MSDRVPFRFPFNPPPNALPLVDATYLTQAASTIGSGIGAITRFGGAGSSSGGVGGGALGAGSVNGGSALSGEALGSLVKLLAGVVAAGALWRVFRSSPPPMRRVTRRDLEGGVNEQESKEEIEARITANGVAAGAAGGAGAGAAAGAAGRTNQGRNNSTSSKQLEGQASKHIAHPSSGGRNVVASVDEQDQGASWATAGLTPEEKAAAQEHARKQSQQSASQPGSQQSEAGSQPGSQMQSASASQQPGSQMQTPQKQPPSSQQSAASQQIPEGDSEEEEEESAADDAADVESTPRRSTINPEFSHIDSISKRDRKSARKSAAPNRRTSAPEQRPIYASPSKIAAVEEARRARAAAREARINSGLPPQKPFSLGIITPRSLQRYGNLLKEGFDELHARQQTSASSSSSAASASSAENEGPLLRSVELCVPEEGETAAAFSLRIRQEKDFDILLIQYHGSQGEDPIAFVDYSDFDDVSRILLLHRPEEILQRHELHIFKDSQFNVHKLLREVDVVVLLGQAARPAILEVFPAEERGAANICVVPHGFFDLLGAEQLKKPKQLAPIAVAGSYTTWSDMRWVADLMQLRAEISKRNAENLAKKRSSGGGASKKHAHAAASHASHNVVVYACGSFVTYTHPLSKEPIDELARLTRDFPDLLTIVTASELDAVQSVVDVASLKKLLWTLSAEGCKVVVTTGDLSARLHSLHADLFDFNVQLYRELLCDFRPKIEYSGSLHARPGASIPIVFAGDASEDVAIEGMQLITVGYEGAAADAEADSSAPAFVAAAASSPAAAAASGVSESWYPAAHYAPDFRRAIDALFRYLSQPAHFQSHRVATAMAASQLSMRHVAAQYEAIIKQLGAAQ